VVYANVHYKGSENTETTLKANRYSQVKKNEEITTVTPPSTQMNDDTTQQN